MYNDYTCSMTAPVSTVAGIAGGGLVPTSGSATASYDATITSDAMDDDIFGGDDAL
jgi:hypothetical protein